MRPKRVRLPEPEEALAERGITAERHVIAWDGERVWVQLDGDAIGVYPITQVTVLEREMAADDRGASVNDKDEQES